MAIEEHDRYDKQLFKQIFTIGGPSSETYTQILSELNAQPFNESNITLEIVCAGLNSSVTLAQSQGNTKTFANMSPILDEDTGAVISDVLTNGTYIIKTTLRAFHLGLELFKDSATTGTVTIIGRA